MTTRMAIKFAFYENFRMNEETLANRHPKEMAMLKSGEGILFINLKGNMLRFVPRSQRYSDLSGKDSQHTILPSLIYRITDGGTWSPYMLKNYAATLEIELVGLKTFQEHYTKILEQKAAARVAARKNK